VADYLTGSKARHLRAMRGWATRLDGAMTMDGLTCGRHVNDDLIGSKAQQLKGDA
jgi:hypothetical protein